MGHGGLFYDVMKNHAKIAYSTKISNVVPIDRQNKVSQRKEEIKRIEAITRNSKSVNLKVPKSRSKQMAKENAEMLFKLLNEEKVQGQRKEVKLRYGLTKRTSIMASLSTPRRARKEEKKEE